MERYLDDYWVQLLYKYGGFYECPVDRDGNRLGPLVGYSGRDNEGRQYVGEVYFDFAVIERRGALLRQVAKALSEGLDPYFAFSGSSGICSIPNGGTCLGTAMQLLNHCYHISPDRHTVRLATQTSREEYQFVWGRHAPQEGEKLIIVDDVCNSFRSVDNMVSLIHSAGATVSAIACVINRSKIQGVYKTPAGSTVPVVELARVNAPFYNQSDAEVSEDVLAGRVVWSPKKEMRRLLAAMEAAQRA